MKGEVEEPVAQKYQQVSDEEETKVDNGKKEGEEWGLRRKRINQKQYVVQSQYMYLCSILMES